MTDVHLNHCAADILMDKHTDRNRKEGERCSTTCAECLIEKIEELKAESLKNGTMKKAGGVKFNKGKPRMSLLSWRWLRGVAQVLLFGEGKYAAHNWQLGIVFSELADAIARHLYAWLDGEENDPESGLCHLWHASCGLMFLSHLRETRPDLDDRYCAVGAGELSQPERALTETRNG